MIERARFGIDPNCDRSTPTLVRGQCGDQRPNELAPPLNGEEFLERRDCGIIMRRDCEREVDIVTGCLFLISREVWDRLGGFDPIFVMYGEEADLCLRARRLGLRPAITPDATIIHYGGASEPVRSDKMVRLLRAKAELIKRHFPAATRRVGLTLLMLLPLSRFVALWPATHLPNQPHLAQKACVWREIWSRRDEWRKGF